MKLNIDIDLLERWRPWEKKFAIFPRWINGKPVFGTYYERCTLCFPDLNIERTTSIFDVLKSS